MHNNYNEVVLELKKRILFLERINKNINKKGKCMDPIKSDVDINEARFCVKEELEDIRLALACVRCNRNIYSCIE